MTDKAWLWWLLGFMFFALNMFDLVKPGHEAVVGALPIFCIATASIHDAIAKLKGPTQ